MGVILTALGLEPQDSQGQPAWTFSDQTEAAGLTLSHGFDALVGTLTQRAAGGVAAGDYDRDGDVDLYVIAGKLGRNALFRNRGDGTFQDVALEAGVALEGVNGSGPLFFDFDGDGWLDLFVGATDEDYPTLFRNSGHGDFTDVTKTAGLWDVGSTISASAGDYDGDAWLDLFLSHWGSAGTRCHLWRNERGARFRCVDEEAGITPFLVKGIDQTFTANFVDVDGDRRQDLLVAGDFGTSRVLRNVGEGKFERWQSSVISDENGMGSAIGDYDGDGALDWFVSSIRDADGTTEGDWGTSGNRLYRNLGDGGFEDVTDAAGVRDGDWGWAACFADFNLDGLLDLAHVTGWPRGADQFRGTPARLFVALEGGHFEEQGEARGFVERNGGRGLVCLDYDRDGDVDLFVMNNSGPARLWRNDSGDWRLRSLSLQLAGRAPNTQAIGSIVRVVAGGRAQVRSLRAGSNYVSQDPAEVQFGLAGTSKVDLLTVTWPDGRETRQHDVAIERSPLIIEEPDPPRPSGWGCSMAGAP